MFWKLMARRPLIMCPALEIALRWMPFIIMKELTAPSTGYLQPKKFLNATKKTNEGMCCRLSCGHVDVAVDTKRHDWYHHTI